MNSPFLSLPVGSFPTLDMTMAVASQMTASLDFDGLNSLDSGMSSAFASALPSGALSADDCFQFTSFSGPSDVAMAPDTFEAAIQKAAASLMANGVPATSISLNEKSGKGAVLTGSVASMPKRVRQRKSYDEDSKEKNEKRLLHNRISAKQSRERKKAFIAALQQQVMELSQLHKDLELAVQRLNAENEELRAATSRQCMEV